jgi:DNA-directed RNA polymerase specialized sigma24 family protein
MTQPTIRERKIYEMRRRGSSYAEIGRLLGLSPERIRQICYQAKGRILVECPPDSPIWFYRRERFGESLPR